MGLTDRAKADWQRFTENKDEWGIEMNFTAPTAETATVVGLHTKHHLQVSPEGVAVNAKNAHVTVSEALFTAAAYPVRNAAGEVDMKTHRVSAKDSTGILKEYAVQQAFQDETVGVIVFILGDFQS